jgi:hypothetical protein
MRVNIKTSATGAAGGLIIRWSGRVKGNERLCRSLQFLVQPSSLGPALGLYQLFRDPHSAFDMATRQYSFMTIGPVSPLSFSGSPLFLNVFNTVDAFLSANGLSKQHA